MRQQGRSRQEQEAGEGEGEHNKWILTLTFLKTYWKIIFAITWAMFLAPFLFIYNVPVTFPDSLQARVDTVFLFIPFSGSKMRVHGTTDGWVLDL